MVAPRFHVGCTGWGYDDWKGSFYPPGAPAGELLERYSRVFSIVELDATYYAMPPLERVERWARATPDGFLFTVKLPGLMTHEASLRGVDDVLDRFLGLMEPITRAGKLASFLVQFPATFVPERDASALEDFLGILPSRHRWAVELRHKKWWTERTYEALRGSNASLVWSVNQYADVPPVETADFLYTRLIGDRELTRYNEIQRDLTPEIRAWNARVAKTERAKDVFVLVNNHFMGFAPGTARIVQDVLGLPPADLAKAARLVGQQGLGDFS